MVANFSESFIDFVNRVEQSLPKQFKPVRMMEHNGRVAALTAEYSMVSLILVSGEVDKAVIRKLKGKISELRYEKPDAGRSSIRVALVDLEHGKIYINRMGAPLRALIKDLI